MEVIIKGDTKEISALVAALQERKDCLPMLNLDTKKLSHHLLSTLQEEGCTQGHLRTCEIRHTDK